MPWKIMQWKIRCKYDNMHTIGTSSSNKIFEIFELCHIITPKGTVLV